jgi:hypothetical protein
MITVEVAVRLDPAFLYFYNSPAELGPRDANLLCEVPWIALRTSRRRVPALTEVSGVRLRLDFSRSCGKIFLVSREMSFLVLTARR